MLVASFLLLMGILIIAIVVIEAIANVARTGKVGDGKIFVRDLEQAIRIRTGETGTAAT
jgi:nitrogen regulatory protein PII